MALPAVEDQIEFRDASGAPRVLRGVITNETDRSITVSRRDGDWEIERSRITKVVRRTPRKPNPIAAVIDSSRQKEERLRQAAAAAMADAAVTLEAALCRDDVTVEEVARLRKRLADASATWRGMR
jgi:hypothetical protein